MVTWQFLHLTSGYPVAYSGIIYLPTVQADMIIHSSLCGNVIIIWLDKWIMKPCGSREHFWTLTTVLPLE